MLTIPSDWLLGKTYEYHCTATVDHLPAGNYKLAVSVYVLQQNKPGIHLAVDKAISVDGWGIVGEIWVDNILVYCYLVKKERTFRSISERLLILHRN